jgi:hypothetical protein
MQALGQRDSKKPPTSVTSRADGTPNSEKVAATSESKKQSQKSQKLAPSPISTPPTQQYTPPTHEYLLFLPSFHEGSHASRHTLPWPRPIRTTCVTLPSVTHFSNALHTENAYPTEDTMSSYMNYPPPQYNGFNPQVRPLFLGITFPFSPLTELSSDAASFTPV